MFLVYKFLVYKLYTGLRQLSQEEGGAVQSAALLLR